MSHFFGFIKKNSSLDFSIQKKQLQNSIPYFPADATGIYEDDCIYLNNQFLFNSPESVFQTNICSNNDYVLVASVRLDNREELYTKLHPTTTKKITEITDYELLLAAYTKWKDECTSHLIGAFSFVIWHKKNKTLFFAKDQLGIRPLFYLENKDAFVFSTSITCIKSFLKQKPTINLLYTSYILKRLIPPVEQTFFTQIKRLQPAHNCIFSLTKGLQKEKKYWELTAIDISHLKNDSERYQQLNFLFNQAITCRARSVKNIGCQLSGGLDSSAIAVLLARNTNKQKLHTFSFVLNETTRPHATYGVDEQETQNKIITYAELITKNHHKIEDYHFKDVYEEFDTTNKIMGGLAHSNGIWQSTLFKEQAKYNIGISFSGFPGDECVSNSGTRYYYDAIYQKQYKKLWNDLGFLALRRVIGYYRLKLKKYITFENQIQNNFLEKKSSYYKKLPNGHLNNISSFKAYLKEQITRTHTTLRTESEGLYAREFGIETVYPMADIRLIQFVYSLPTNMFKPQQYTRNLFRNLCKNILPNKVRLQPKFNGANTLAFSNYIHFKNAKSLGNYRIKNRYQIINCKKIKKLHNNDSKLITPCEVDYLIEKNN